MEDLQKAKYVEVEMSHEGVLWVNVDGMCVFRCQDVEHLIIGDYTVNQSVSTDSVFKE